MTAHALAPGAVKAPGALYELVVMPDGEVCVGIGPAFTPEMFDTMTTALVAVREAIKGDDAL